MLLLADERENENKIENGIALYKVRLRCLGVASPSYLRKYISLASFKSTLQNRTKIYERN